MTEEGKITREDIHLKARIITEGVRLEGLGRIPFKEWMDWSGPLIPNDIDPNDIEDV